MHIVYVPNIRKIISPYGVGFYEAFFSGLAYTSQPYSEAMALRPSVTYTPCAISYREQTDDIIMFTQFEEGSLLSETCNDAESGDESMTIQLCHHYLAKNKLM